MHEGGNSKKEVPDRNHLMERLKIHFDGNHRMGQAAKTTRMKRPETISMIHGARMDGMPIQVCPATPASASKEPADESVSNQVCCG